MNRKTTTALVVFIALGVTAYFVMSQPPKGQHTTDERSRPIAPLSEDQIKRVKLVSKGSEIVLVKAGAGWKMTKPVDDDADEYATKSLVETLTKLEFGDMVTEQKAKHAEHEVDAEKGVRVTVGDDGKPLADFFVGQTVEGFTMVRRADSDQVYQAVGSIKHAFEKETKLWRNRVVVKLDRAKARTLDLTTADGQIVLTREADKKPWKVQSSAVEIDQLDESAANGFLSAISNLTAFDFADDAKPDKTGLDKPRATLVVKLEGGKQHRLLIGATQKDDSFIKTADDPQVYTVKQNALDNLIKRPVDFRDPSVLSFKEDDVVSLTITKLDGKNKSTLALARKGADWHANGKKLPDASQASGAVKALALLKADRFAKNDADALGMREPAWRIEIALKDRTRHQLTVGGKDQGGFFGLSRKGVADLFELRKYKLDRFCLDPEKFK